MQAPNKLNIGFMYDNTKSIIPKSYSLAIGGAFQLL
jgi:hypothetical protein